MSAVWSQWYDNPFKAIKEIASPKDYRKAVKVLSDSATWDDWGFDYTNYLLERIGYETNVVVQQDPLTGKFRAAYDI